MSCQINLFKRGEYDSNEKWRGKIWIFLIVSLSLEGGLRERLNKSSKENTNVFTIRPKYMPCIDPWEHNSQAQYWSQSKAHTTKEEEIPKREERDHTILSRTLRETIVVREVDYLKWLSNVMLVKKAYGESRMCVDFIAINEAYPKDCFPLPSIIKLVNIVAIFGLLSFLEALSYH